MKIKNGILAFLLIVLCGCNKPKLAWVDVKELVTDYEEMVDVQAKYQTKDSLYNRKFDSLQTALQLEVQQYRQAAPKLGANARQQRETEILTKERLMQRQAQQEDQQLRQTSQQEIDSVIAKVRRFVKSYGKDKGYTYIMGANDAGSVMYGPEEQNVTQNILRELNQEYSGKK